MLGIINSVNSFNVGNTGLFGMGAPITVTGTFTSIQVQRSGGYRVANASLEGYYVYMGLGFTGGVVWGAPVFTATLPYNIPIVPATAATYYVYVQKQNRYGISSINQNPTVFDIRADGSLDRGVVPAPENVSAIVQPQGRVRVFAEYTNSATLAYPADEWEIYASTGTPVPGTDTPAATVAVAGDNFYTDITLAAGTYTVGVVLYRSVDGARSTMVTTELTVPGIPEAPVAVLGGLQV